MQQPGQAARTGTLSRVEAGGWQGSQAGAAQVIDRSGAGAVAADRWCR